MEIIITLLLACYCYICSEACDCFPKRLDLALAPNITQMKGLRSNGIFGDMINCGALSLD